MEAPNQPEISRGKQFADFFALKRNLVIILVAIFVIGTGEELWMRFVPKYLQTLGASVFIIGLYDGLSSLVGAIVAANRYSMGIGVQMVIKRVPIMVAPLMGGILIDRFGVIPGVRVALIISILLAGATFIALRELRQEVKPSEETAPSSERWNFLRCLREFDAPMRWLLLSDILVRFCERIPFAW